MILIPAIDLKDGLCVRLRQGRMDDETVFSNRPVDIAAQWVQQGARRLHLVDLNGAFEGEPVNHGIVKAIAHDHPNVPVQIGGGIRDLETIERYLSAGVAFVIIGTQAVKKPEFVKEACAQFPGHIIVGLDAKDGLVATEGWAEASTLKALDVGRQFESHGVSAIVFTDIERDGMMQGVNWDSTLTLSQGLKIPVIASGGVANIDDVRQLADYRNDNIMGAITGRAIYEGGLSFVEGQQKLDKWVEDHAS